ncbi:MAG TPA: AI-2E family transporter [Baekduia sp.]|nr:AI-2E family transporter [Baekduia sp.]
MERGQIISTRVILRVIACVVLCAIALALLWTLRKPIGWLLMAGFIAVALSGPMNALHRRGMPRGLAIAAVYIVLLLIPAGVVAIVVPPIVTQATQLAEDAPRYADDTEKFIHNNKQLRELNDKYDLSTELQKQAKKLPEKIGDAASVLGSIGLGLVNSIFALVNILILSVFLLASGRTWIDRLIDFRPADERERLRRIADRVGDAVGGYVQGAMLVALIAGMQTYVVLAILGVPFRGPLAVMAGLASLVPLVGATIAAFLIAAVTLFTNFPVATVIWVVWAIVYQQLENNILQPQIQKRTIQVNPLIVLIAVLFGSTLLGIVGALVAIPAAASIQIIVREYFEFRRDTYGRVAHEDLPGDDEDDVDPPTAAPDEETDAPADRRTFWSRFRPASG